MTLFLRQFNTVFFIQCEITNIVQNNMANSHVLPGTSRDIVGIGTSFQSVMSNVIGAAFQSSDNTSNCDAKLLMKNSTNTSNYGLLPKKVCLLKRDGEVNSRKYNCKLGLRAGLKPAVP